jgi:hypothetical protein
MILYKRVVLLTLICMGLELGSAGNLRAQRRYVETLGLSSAFTPQVVVDGRTSFVRSDKPRILAAMAQSLITFPIIIDLARGELTVTVPERTHQERYDVNLIAYLPQAATNVGRGENSGRTLREFNIVRQFRSLGVWNGQESVFPAPVDSFPADATRVAVLLQRNQQGPIVGSAMALLR